MLLGRIVARTRSNFIRSPNSNLNFLCCQCHNSDNPQNEENKENKLPEEPTTCCMSGCANCVWIEYAQKLSEYYKDGGEKALKEIEEKVTDPNMKAFLLHEWRMMKK